MTLLRKPLSSTGKLTQKWSLEYNVMSVSGEGGTKFCGNAKTSDLMSSQGIREGSTEEVTLDLGLEKWIRFNEAEKMDILCITGR